MSCCLGNPCHPKSVKYFINKRMGILILGEEKLVLFFLEYGEE